MGLAGLAGGFVDVLVRVEDEDGNRLTRVASGALTEVLLRPGSAGTWDRLVLGVEHILGGVDHLLFVAGMILLVRGWRRLVATITAFTVAHSITLGMTVLDVVRVPGPPVEAFIALSIVYLAFKILRRDDAAAGSARPWTMAFAFGLMHGFGFAGALLDTGLAGRDVPMTLLLFNLGIELGQIAFAAACGVVLWGCSRLLGTPARRVRLRPRRRVRPGRRSELLGHRAGRRILGVRRERREPRQSVRPRTARLCRGRNRQCAIQVHLGRPALVSSARSRVGRRMRDHPAAPSEGNEMSRYTLALLLVVVWCAPAGAQDRWPQFRGPGARGVSEASGLPTSWSTTENVAWAADLPGLGWSSPVVWDGNRLRYYRRQHRAGRGASGRALSRNARPGAPRRRSTGGWSTRWTSTPAPCDGNARCIAAPRRAATT